MAEPVIEQSEQPNHHEMLPEQDHTGPDRGHLPLFNLDHQNVQADGLGSPTMEGSSPSDFSPFKKMPQRHITGNSASGLILPTKHGKRQELPKSIFSSVVALPKLKEKESHKKFVTLAKDKEIKTFELPPYRGYQSGMLDEAQEKSNKDARKKVFQARLDSRYRFKNPLKEQLHLTWGLNSKLEWQTGKKVEIRNLEDPEVKPNKKSEREYLEMGLNASDDENPYDEERKFYIGPNAINDYNRHYKVIKKVESENQIKKVKNSIYTSILSNIYNKNLLPMRMNVIKPVGDAKVINTNGFMLGNQYAEVLMKGLSDEDNLQRVLLRGNNISSEEVVSILQKSPIRAEEIDLSENNIGRYLEYLRPIIIDPNSNLKILSLDKVNMSDKAAIDLLGWVSNSKAITSISLSENKLSDAICDSLCKLLEKSSILAEIYLAWNNISSVGGEPLFRVLAKNESVRVFDICMNSLGSNMKVYKKNANTFLEALCTFFTTNKKVLHLNLNNNGFSYEECQKIAEAVNKNNTIYGFHFSGNYGYTDFLEYLKFDKTQHDPLDKITIHRIKGLEPTAFSYDIDQFEFKTLLTNCCWICEGWIEVEFIYPGDANENEPVFILLKHEDYSLVYMPISSEGDRRVSLMVPRMKLFFTFFHNDQLKTHRDLPIVHLTTEETVAFQFLGQEYQFEAAELNYLIFDCTLKPLFSESYEPECLAKPRTPREKYIPPKALKNRRKWNFANSIFRTYKKDTDLLMENCFDNDFALGRYQGFVKEKKDMKLLKTLLKRMYREIKQIYKHYSSYSGMDRIMCIGELMILTIANDMGICENPEFSNEVILAFKNANFTDKKFAFYQKGCLCRYQWLEFIVRLAAKKYMEAGEAENYSQSLQMLYDKFLQNFAVKFDDNGWKENVYWCEEMDEIYTKHLKLMEYLFKAYSGARAKPGKAPFMALEEFRAFVMDFGLEEFMISAEIPECYNEAMMTQIDEVDSERCAEMSFVEFLEAFARIADHVSFKGINKQADINPDLLKKQKLWIKTEALLKYIAAHGRMNKKMVTGFGLPAKSIFDEKDNLIFD